MAHLAAKIDESFFRTNHLAATVQQALDFAGVGVAPGAIVHADKREAPALTGAVVDFWQMF
ncbi:MAG: hypothetical protein ACOYNF_03380 [Rhodoferax sp.]